MTDVHPLMGTLAQCPCSGGGTGILVVLASAGVVWFVLRGIVGALRDSRLPIRSKLVRVVPALILIGGAGSLFAASWMDRSNQSQATRAASGKPTLVEFGSAHCQPCRMMAPILDQLHREYADSLRVEFVDVQQDRQAGSRHAIRLIPTQVFFDAEGRELFRHQGFYPKQNILGKWKELGVDLTLGRSDASARPKTTAAQDGR